MNFDFLYYPYSSQRMTVFAKKGMVGTSQPLAAQAGLRVMQKGGNAVDAAVATAACLTVTEPTSNGIGGDAFALVWSGGKLHGLNSSGPSPESLSIEALHKRGLKEMPELGPIPVTTPGIPAAWAELSRRFGRLPFKQLLEPAIEYAEKGFPVSPVIGMHWKEAYEAYEQELDRESFEEWGRVFAPGGRVPAVGEVWSSAAHGSTLRKIAESEAEEFYRGELADRIDEFFRSKGGFLSKRDLEAFNPEWVDPIHVRYRGYDVWEIPPNGQGLVALMALNILRGLEVEAKEEELALHRQIEAMKLAFADGTAQITEASKMKIPVTDLLSESFAAERRKLVTERAIDPKPGVSATGGTVYLATADEDGNMVSFIQSNYKAFGSGMVVPETGIAMQNRGCNFSMDPEHPNALEPGKRTYHTIIPGFLTKNGEPVGPFGVMGGFMQPQGHLQVMINTIDRNLNPQAVLDAPRWQWMGGKTILFEQDVPAHVVQALARRGHDVRISPFSEPFGRGQIIWRDGTSGVLCGGTEKRSDGAVAAW
ncbi:MAG: gamma-glutamyltransferase family protein [Thermovirgaceae bacterium]